jgi:hypothetical protein
MAIVLEHGTHSFIVFEAATMEDVGHSWNGRRTRQKRCPLSSLGGFMLCVKPNSAMHSLKLPAAYSIPPIYFLAG